jgi:hypothetical protein
MLPEEIGDRDCIDFTSLRKTEAQPSPSPVIKDEAQKGEPFKVKDISFGVDITYL